MRGSDFRVVALISSFNEGDIIAAVIEHLVSNGIHAYLIDNHSTDDTVEQAGRWLGRGLLGIERFPADGDTGRYAWGDILRRKEELAATLQADWFIHHDADEVREGPFPGLDLRDAIRWVDLLGYNCIDFRTIEFRPTDDAFRQGDDPKAYFQFMEEGSFVDRVQRKCWKAGVGPVALAETGGHDVSFEDRRVFPIRFLLRHYSVRGQTHGLRKVFSERRPRFVPSERERGWHVQYDAVRDEGHRFLRDPATLTPFDLDRARFELLLPSDVAREVLDRAHVVENRLRHEIAAREAAEAATAQVARQAEVRLSEALSRAQARLHEENGARVAAETARHQMELRSLEDRLAAARARSELASIVESFDQERGRAVAELERLNRWGSHEQGRREELERRHAELATRLAETEARLQALKDANARTLLARARARLDVWRQRRDRRLVLASPLFDRDWYLATYPDLVACGADPAEHYTRFGATEGRDPGPGFSTRAYLEANPDVAATRANPLVHFERFGRAEGRPLAPAAPDSVETPPVVVEAPPEPEAPAPAASTEVLQRVEAWRALRRDRQIVARSPYFDRAGYVARNPDVSSSGLDPADHYLRFGAAEGRDPGPDFRSRAYLAANPDVARTGMNPLVHYERFGRAEGRALAPNAEPVGRVVTAPVGMEDENALDDPATGLSLPDAEVERVSFEGDGVVVEGWALWPTRRLPQTIRVFHDGVLVGRGRVHLSRPDVRSYYPGTPGAIHSGFRVVANVPAPPAGAAPLRLTLEFSDADGRAIRREARAPRRSAGDARVAGFGPLLEAVDAARELLGREPAVLDWNTGLDLRAVLPHAQVFSPPQSAPGLPYLDRSIDLIVAPEAAVEEARRVATLAVFTVDAQARAVSEAWRAPVETREPPTVSILIPAFNHSATTDACLAAVAETLPPDFRGEILVIDDASSDDTPLMLSRWLARDSRVRVLRNEANLGFLDSCNRAAEEASGEILVFLNNDTLPRPGWLPPLLRVLTGIPRAGAVGGKLLYPDGTLQEAGGIIFNDASGCNVGRGDASPDRPAYNMLREVDYCSGALLATPRDLFLSLGGFDRRFRPAYYEDTDYCFTLWDRGYRVFYQPESEIVHLEGVTSGTDLSTGVKSYQVVNRVKFTEKWQVALAGQMAPQRIDVGAIHNRTTGRTPR